ncbi:ergosterol biosynthetic protein 28 homolog isoform X1 [Herpailurus yagouaroundi]|uniref:ergosterol biosynthetic protein 28 homolog isoform X1 n=1 Tax=Herpailurus yagouaroundi TaxID=1608482 RepID=UPI00072E33C2|nr:ergosterol biosynthetic protein 28 homolog isoform X1 [Puma yagouaroundi]
MSRFLNVLRSWLVMVSIIAMGNTLQSFRDHTFLYEKLYTGKPDLVNGLQARTFGIWTLLSSVIRCLCAIDIHNKTYAKILNNQPTLQERLKAPQRSLLLMPHSGPSLCGIPRIYLPGGCGLQSQAVPHHTLDLPPRPGPLPLRAVCLWDRSSHDWRPGTPDGGKFLDPGYASWASVPRSRTSIQTEEEKLRPTLPAPRLHPPPLLSPTFILPPLLVLLFCTILSPLTPC